MYSFSDRSRKKLSTCHPQLQGLFNEIIKHHDCSILCGHRSEEDQNDAFSKNLSKLEYPNSKHNRLASRAVDVVPYPIDWNDRERFVYFAGLVKGVAIQMGIGIRWNGDWDSDNDLKDQNFMDLPHFELSP